MHAPIILSFMLSKTEFWENVVSGALSGLIVSLLWAGVVALWFVTRIRFRKKAFAETIANEAHLAKWNQTYRLSLRNNTHYAFAVTNIYFDAGPHVGNLLPWDVAFVPDGTVLSAEKTEVRLRPYGFGFWRVKEDMPTHLKDIRYFDVSYEFALTDAGGTVRGKARINRNLYKELEGILRAVNAGQP